jgi:hypothetical protein
MRMNRKARGLYDPQRHRGPKIFVVDPAMTLLAGESLALWCLGYPDRASERGLAALAMAQTVAHPYGLCWACGGRLCSGSSGGNPS